MPKNFKKENDSRLSFKCFEQLEVHTCRGDRRITTSKEKQRGASFRVIAQARRPLFVHLSLQLNSTFRMMLHALCMTRYLFLWGWCSIILTHFVLTKDMIIWQQLWMRQIKMSDSCSLNFSNYASWFLSSCYVLAMDSWGKELVDRLINAKPVNAVFNEDIAFIGESLARNTYCYLPSLLN